MRVLRKLVPGATTLLDVGCGFGPYLDVGRDHGFLCTGVEPDAERAVTARKRGHEVLDTFFSPELFGPKRFDAVLLSQVIEHLREPKQLLDGLHQCLVPGGVLFVACPNHAGLRSHLMGVRFEHYCPPEHVGYFTPQSLYKLCRRAGFEVLTVRGYSHPLQLKSLISDLVYLRFMRTRVYINPFKPGLPEPDRFVNRPGRTIRRLIYAGVVSVSSLLAPVLNLSGADYIHAYLRKPEVKA